MSPLGDAQRNTVSDNRSDKETKANNTWSRHTDLTIRSTQITFCVILFWMQTTMTMKRKNSRGTFMLMLGLAVMLIGLVHADSGKESIGSDWKHFFEQAQVDGTMVVLDQRDKAPSTMIYNTARAKRAYSPASTYKIPHTLFALDAGVVRDEFQIIKWDGKKRGYPAWNADQNLRSSMRHSAVWVYQQFAAAIGDEREREYMKKINYGNAATSGKDPFWVKGDLAISAIEQITFLERLYQNKLPFQEVHQRLVKDIMIVEAGQDWILRAKSGWSGSIGWWVGWVECPTGPVFFALNMDTPHQLADLPKREKIARSVLRSLNALPQPKSAKPKPIKAK